MAVISHLLLVTGHSLAETVWWTVPHVLSFELNAVAVHAYYFSLYVWCIGVRWKERVFLKFVWFYCWTNPAVFCCMIIQRKALAALKTPKADKQETTSEATKRRMFNYNIKIVFIFCSVVITSQWKWWNCNSMAYKSYMIASLGILIDFLYKKYQELLVWFANFHLMEAVSSVTNWVFKYVKLF